MLSQTGNLECQVGDPFNLGLPVDHGVDGNRFTMFLMSAFWLAEVQPAGQFPE